MDNCSGTDDREKVLRCAVTIIVTAVARYKILDKGYVVIIDLY